MSDSEDITITESTIISWVDEFVNIVAGEPYRLLPFGTIVKNGETREITPDYARRFRLPHFKPAIKLGSHEDATPAGGHILRLEVRNDGLYAIPELNVNGTTAVTEGHYRYHSPEVIWEGGGYTDPETGDFIEGPLIVGDALLHTPYLGEATALYEYQVITDGGNNMSEMTQVPTPLWERFTAWFDNVLEGDKPEPKPEPTPVSVTPEPTPKPQVDADEFTALQKERDDFKAQLEAQRAEIEQMKAEQAQAGRIAHFAATFKDTPLADNGDLHELLTAVDEEVADKLTVHFKALAAQADAANVTDPVGGSGDADAGGDGLTPDQYVSQIMKEQNIDNYVQALDVARVKRPELFSFRMGGNR